MRNHRAYEFDNRDSAQMYDYLEARIDAMKRRIAELEMDNARLTCELQGSRELMSVRMTRPTRRRVTYLSAAW